MRKNQGEEAGFSAANDIKNHVQTPGGSEPQVTQQAPLGHYGKGLLSWNNKAIISFCVSDSHG